MLRLNDWGSSINNRTQLILDEARKYFRWEGIRWSTAMLRRKLVAQSPLQFATENSPHALSNRSYPG